MTKAQILITIGIKIIIGIFYNIEIYPLKMIFPAANYTRPIKTKDFRLILPISLKLIGLF